MLGQAYYTVREYTQTGVSQYRDGIVTYTERQILATIVPSRGAIHYTTLYGGHVDDYKSMYTYVTLTVRDDDAKVPGSRVLFKGKWYSVTASKEYEHAPINHNKYSLVRDRTIPS